MDITVVMAYGARNGSDCLVSISESQTSVEVHMEFGMEVFYTVFLMSALFAIATDTRAFRAS